MNSRLRLFVVFAVFHSLACLAQPASVPTDLERRVDAYLRPLLDEDLISGSVLIAQNGKILVAKGYGPANREFDQPCTAETRHRLASVSKQFTATAILLLQEDGKLSVQDPLSKFLPDYPRGDEITLHHLLTHTSGVVNYSRLPENYRIWCMPHTLDQVIDRFKNEPLEFEPGARWSYSNSGYVLLSAVIEKASGMGWEAFLKARIFEPLNMAATCADVDTRVIPQRATGHYNHGEGMVQAPYLNVAYTAGAGGLVSTVGDLYKWDRALYGTDLLAEASKEAMFTPVQANYGYGWFISEMLGHRVIEHRGGLNGFLTQIYRFVDDDVCVITLFNYVSTFAGQVSQSLAALALGQEVEPILIPQGVEVDETLVSGYAGTYRLQEGYDLVVDVADGKLRVAAPGQAPTVGVPQNARTFYLRGDNALVQFRNNREGKPMMILAQSEHMYPCLKVQ